jgi:hypothetical protein
VLAVGAAVVTSNALAGVSNGTQKNGSIYQYGTR